MTRLVHTLSIEGKKFHLILPNFYDAPGKGASGVGAVGAIAFDASGLREVVDVTRRVMPTDDTLSPLVGSHETCSLVMRVTR